VLPGRSVYVKCFRSALTVNHVVFTSRADGKLLPIQQIPPRIFSEVMRDLDLVVSVAHRGGVDPEATHSTVEMRSALLRETLRLLRLKNVRLDGRHAFIEGQVGSYNVHLGSGIVHRQPGGSLCIIPVHSQHRGRLFLPFAAMIQRLQKLFRRCCCWRRMKTLRTQRFWSNFVDVSADCVKACKS
jgi:hypothetical protein